MITEFLQGLRVLDLSQYLPGPFATRLLADMGADVVKVEPPAGDPLRTLDTAAKPGGASPFYRMINAGKTILALDLKDKTDNEAFARLVQRADVLLESFRPGVLDRLGFGPERLAALNPALIHCALSGFGQTGPYRLVPGHDLGYAAVTGTVDATGTPEAPVIPYPPMADHAGAMQSVATILGALMARSRSGRGCFLDISLSESLLSWQAPALTVPPARGAAVINGGAAFYQIYRTGDGQFVTLSPLEPKFWANFCNAVARPDWTPRQFEPLPQHALIADLAGLFAAEPRAHWDDLLGDAECCYEPAHPCTEVADHPQIRARGLLHEHDGMTEVLFPAYVDGAPPPMRTPVRDGRIADVLAEWE
ncbi:MAG: CoA transferase [Rhodospirillales bacterium]|nr:CoA transferase [Rhodospirillales bacterium]